MNEQLSSVEIPSPDQSLLWLFLELYELLFLIRSFGNELGFCESLNNKLDT